MKCLMTDLHMTNDGLEGERNTEQDETRYILTNKRKHNARVLAWASLPLWVSFFFFLY